MGLPPQLTVIIPSLNEVESLPPLLKQLQEQQGLRLEIIVSDGGSTDGTVAAIERIRGIRIVESNAGRGRQMNKAARLATAPFLLFLHADSVLLSIDQLHNALSSLKAYLAHRGDHRAAGHFRIKFKRTLPGNHLAYRYYEAKSALNRPECTNGDQGFMLHREFFDALGGFDESMDFLEDQRFAETVRQNGEWITLPGVIQTSARRFEQEGFARRMILSALIMNFHAIGFREFFEQAPELYRTQQRTTRLRMTPYFQLIHHLNEISGAAISRQRWLATGKYVRNHAWQLFFFLDVVRERITGSKKRSFLWLHDHIIGCAIHNTLGTYFAVILAWVWYKLARRWYRAVDYY